MDIDRLTIGTKVILKSSSLFAIKFKIAEILKKHKIFISEIISHLDILHQSYSFLSECFPNRFYTTSHFLGETVILKDDIAYPAFSRAVSLNFS